MTTKPQVTSTMPCHTLARAITMATSTLLLFACGGANGSSETASTTTTPTSRTEAAALKVQIQQLEASGKLPNLDRSASIAGPDANNNGVRDDIEAYIAALPVTPLQKAAAMQHAKVFQQTLTVDLKDTVALDRIGALNARAINCAGDVFMPRYQDGYDLGSKLEAMTANTKERAKQYLAYNRAVSGTTGSMPTGNTCDP